MERRIITVYCLIDEYLKLLGIKDDVRSSVSNAEILLIGYIAVSDFAGNYRKTHTYFQMIGCCKMVEYSRFIRRLNEMERIIEKLFMWLGDVFIKLEGSQIYSVDSFPVELCQITREKRCHLWRAPELKGFNASTCKFFYGLKVHMVVTTDKSPVRCYISHGSMHDVKAAYKLLPQRPSHSLAIGDKGYVSSKLTLFLASFGIDLSPLQRNNRQRENTKDYYAKRRIRKGVETAFSMITAKFGKVIKATSIGGFLTKLKLFLTAYSIDCFLKLPQDKQKLVFN
ncbi:MAG TPA: IS982 family transposase [Sulfurospirillum cavolei]|uniref:IS982 family transposase n=3 Tax=Sulfurospirillum TaxID=57665 RepID=A0A2D3WD41_9BACT|nr:MAG TPA: IS982 family transposase [Sulfurospirillum cavolei]